MAIHPGRHQFGPDSGRLTLRTSRDGLAAQAGHDLTIDATRWSAELVVADDRRPASLQATIDLGALAVREGTGGLKPLTDRDKREISMTARKVLSVDRFPEATFAASAFQPADGDSSAGGVISGTFTLAGQTRPLELSVRAVGPETFQASTQVRQTDFGIKPYSGFLGALKVRDTVEIEVEVNLPATAAQEPDA